MAAEFAENVCGDCACAIQQRPPCDVYSWCLWVTWQGCPLHPQVSFAGRNALNDTSLYDMLRTETFNLLRKSPNLKSQNIIDVVASRSALDGNYVLVLTTNSVESGAVRSIIKHASKAEIGRETRGARIGLIGGRFCVHLNGASGAQENCSIGSLTRWMTQTPRPIPQLIVVVGFAWGNPAHVNVGDIIIASKIHDVNHVRRENGTDKRRVADRVSAVGSVAEFLTGILPSPHSATGFLPSQHSGRVFCGELASAEIYLADSSARDAIIQQLPEVLGGEMEAFDVVRDLQVPWLLIKAISDDGGDGVDRSMQNQAAHAAANLVSPTLEVLTSEGILEPAREDVSVQHLIEALHGKALHISRPDGDRLAVVNAMNFEVPRIIQRLSNYVSGQDGQDDLFVETLAVTIVEVAQNAFLHGKASYVNCNFNETSVLLDDDGTAYDPKALTGTRGGATSWRELEDDYIAKGVIEFEATYRKGSGNSYRFKFQKIDFEILKAMTECSVTVVSDGHGFKGSEVSFDQMCSTLYYDLEHIYSISKQKSVESDLILLVESGKSVIVSCRNGKQAEKLSDALAEYRGPKLRFLVAGKA